jgi:hypothetical protein
VPLIIALGAVHGFLLVTTYLTEEHAAKHRPRG